MRIAKSVIREIIDKTDIVALIGEFLNLKSRGQNYFAHCPWHQDTTPSFCVNREKRMFHCFSCGRGGNVITFLEDYKHDSFPQAVTELGKRLGINVGNASKHFKPRHPLSHDAHVALKINKMAVKCFHSVLIDTKAGKPGLKYLHSRGLTNKTIDDFKLGFAPDAPILLSMMKGSQITTEQMLKSGLFKRSQRGKLYCVFYNRVIFPIRDRWGRTIAFSGRVLNKKNSPAKYVNTAETELFHKRQTLFNLDKARKEIRYQHNLILCEGYMDVLSTWQSGVHNVIASMGTSLTESQVRQMEYTSPKVTVCYDGDLPGQRAINRAINMLSKSRLRIGVIQMPSGIDPDEYRAKYGEKALNKYMHSAMESTTMFRLKFYQMGLDLSKTRDQIVYLKRASKAIALLPNPTARDVYINSIASQLHINKNSLEKSVAKITRNHLANASHHYNRYGEMTSAQMNPKSRVEAAEQLLIYGMLFNPDVRVRLKHIKNFRLSSIRYQELFELTQAYLVAHHKCDSDDYVSFCSAANLSKLAHQVINLNVPKLGMTAIDDCVRIIMEKKPIENKIRRDEKKLENEARIGDTHAEQRLLSAIIRFKRAGTSNKA